MKKVILKILRIAISLISAILPILAYFAGRDSGIKSEKSRKSSEFDDKCNLYKREIKKLKKKCFFRGRQRFDEGLSDGVDLGIFIGRKQVLNEIRIKKIKEETGIDVGKYQ